MNISRVGEVRCQLGEGPLWDAREQALFFVDVLGQAIWRHEPSSGSFDRWSLPTRVSAMALRETGGAIIASGEGLQRFDFETGALDLVSDPAAGDGRVALNDGKADAGGRFLVGGVDVTGEQPIASIFSLDADGAVTSLDGGFRISNGPCWSPDGGTFYIADSMARAIYAYDYDRLTGAIANRRLFADTSPLPGIPDGATVDARGRVWTAMCDGAAVVCFDANGAISQSITFPTGFPSSVMFGGEDLERLFVTTIDVGSLSSLAVAANAVHRPDTIGGGLFAIDGLDATGLPEHRFAG